MLDGVGGEVFAWPGALSVAGPTMNALGLSMFCSVVAAVVDHPQLGARYRGSHLLGVDKRRNPGSPSCASRR